MIRVYVSGPITKGNRNWNLYQANEVHRILLDAGYAVLNPMLTILFPDEKNVAHGVWLASDLAFIEVCHVVVRLVGESVGADMETAHADKLGIPVVRVDESEWAELPLILQETLSSVRH